MTGDSVVVEVDGEDAMVDDVRTRSATRCMRVDVEGGVEGGLTRSGEAVEEGYLERFYAGIEGRGVGI